MPYNCYPEDIGVINHKPTRTCVGWKNKAEIKINKVETPTDINCYRFSWNVLKEQYYPYDCFSLSGAFWYGGILANTKPFHKRTISRRPLFTSTVNGASEMGPVVEPYWITSEGLAIIVEGNPPLHFSVNENNDGMLCLMSKYSNTAYHNYDHKLPNLNYSICTGSDMKQLHQYVLEQFYEVPERSPPEENILRQPIYSTWAKFKAQINQNAILKYVERLSLNLFDKGVILLQEGWESKHGDVEFDTGAFPNVSVMVDEIRSKGFDVGITVTHMVAPDSQIFQERIRDKILVMDAGKNIINSHPTTFLHHPQIVKYKNTGTFFLTPIESLIYRIFFSSFIM